MTASAIPSNSLRLAGIARESIVDGPGLRMTVFTQGCPHHCPGCHNPETHQADSGFFRNTEELFSEYMENPLLSGITFSGGEPFLQAAPLTRLARAVHEAGGDVVTYTGFYLEQLLEMSRARPEVGDLLDETDLLVDGPFIMERRSLELAWRGSENQRLIYRYDYCSLLPSCREYGEDFLLTAP